VLTGNHQVVVLSVGLWRRAFGGDPQIIGRTIHLNAQPMTIIGVSDPRFRGSVVGLATDLFAPLITHAQLTGENRETTSNDHSIMAFLRVPAVELARVRASMSRASAELAAAYPQPFDDRLERAVLIPIWQWPYGAQSLMLPAVSLIGAMAALLLLVVCANVTGLVLARSVGRRGEIAARLAVGASRARILRQLLIESLVLALPAAMAGLFLPRLAEPFLGRAAADVSSFPLFFNLEPDRLVLAFALALAWISALLYGLAPALRLARVDVATILKEDASPLRPSGGHFRNALVIIQIAMSLMLLVGTSLVVRTLAAAQHADGGFDAHHVAWATFDMRASGHDQTGGRRMYERLLDAIRAEPGVESASLAAYLPLTLIDWQNWNFVPEGYRPRPDEDVSFAVNVVSPGHFQTLRIALLAGRDFSDRDTVETEPVVIINETFARRFWRTPQEAIGQRVEGNGLRRVIGVVRDMKYARLDEQPRPYAYVASGQVYAPEMTLQVRATGTTADVLQRIRSRARAIDASLPVLASGALADQTRSAVALYGTVARIVAMIGMLSAGLAGLGVYGLIAYSVKQSAREIGIRSAMGATPVDIGGRFLRQGITVGCVGVLAGLAIAFALSRLMAAMLFGVAATDPISFISAAAAVLGVALGASSIPAWRAAGVDPLTALRDH
jgi:predicted permease